MPPPARLAQLKACLDRVRPPPGTGRLTLGLGVVDGHLDPGPGRAALHEVQALSPADGAAANAFGLGLALRAGDRRPLVWVFQALNGHEAGHPYGPGLGDWGLSPDQVLLVRVRDAPALLLAGEEALRSGAVGAVVMSSWGEARAMSLTASRRLSLAARAGGATAILVRSAARPGASAAETRWSVSAAVSTELEARAPGRPAFRASLLRSRTGAPPRDWIMEWSSDTRAFTLPPASGGLVSLPRHRPAGARERAVAGRAA